MGLQSWTQSWQKHLCFSLHCYRWFKEQIRKSINKLLLTLTILKCPLLCFSTTVVRVPHFLSAYTGSHKAEENIHNIKCLSTSILQNSKFPKVELATKEPCKSNDPFSVELVQLKLRKRVISNSTDTYYKKHGDPPITPDEIVML